MTKAAFATATFMDTYKGGVAMQLVGSPSKRRGERVTIWQWVPVDVGGVYSGYYPVTSAMRAVRNARTDHRFKHVALTDIGAQVAA